MNGAILYEGLSSIDRQPIVVIAVGLKNKSTNSKTGAMVQTYILRSDINPIEAVKQGEDVSICGTCPHRGDGSGKKRSCYVNLGQGPNAVFKGYKRGIYPKVTAAEATELLAGKMVRIGTYGDPAAAPVSIWTWILSKASGWTGYTHQWKTLIGPGWRKLVMASVDSVEEMHEAQAKGYRTFRVSPNQKENIKGLEVICPASKEAGQNTTCFVCKACAGTSSKAKVSIQIAAHGVGKANVKEPTYATG